MQFDDLKTSWLGDNLGDTTINEGAIERVRIRAAQLHRAIRRRDRLEIGVALVLLPIFVWLAFITRFDVSRVGAVIIAVSCIAIPLRLYSAQRPVPDYALPVTEMLRAELDSVRAQKRLLSSVVWWYAGPLWLGVTLFMIGPLTLWPAVLVTAVATLFMGLIVLLNRAAVRTQLDPRIAELEALLES